MKAIIVAATAFCAIFATAAEAGDLLDRFEGTWQSQGVSFAMPTTGEMQWDLAIGGKFRRLTYTLKMRATDGHEETFEGAAFYKPTDQGSYVATWFDSTGDMHPIAARIEGNALVAIWGTEATKLGRTTYSLQEDGSIKITDEIFTKAKAWKTFNEGTFQRSEQGTAP
jgi:hypothetical protein